MLKTFCCAEYFNYEKCGDCMMGFHVPAAHSKCAARASLVTCLLLPTPCCPVSGVTLKQFQDIHSHGEVRQRVPSEDKEPLISKDPQYYYHTPPTLFLDRKHLVIIHIAPVIQIC